MREDVSGDKWRLLMPPFIRMVAPAIAGLESRPKSLAASLLNGDRAQLHAAQASLVREDPAWASGRFAKDAPGAPALEPGFGIGRRGSGSKDDTGGSPKQPLALRLKRVGDISIAVMSLFLLGPLLLLIALAIKVTMGGPVFFAHSRVGLGGKKFHCLKFRSMVQTSDTALEELLRNNPILLSEWRHTRKLRHDPRITPLGHLLRRSSLDELPQLINILKGEMSCVGPRPVVEDELARYGRSVAYYKNVKPGLTGLWQVSGRNTVSYSRRVALDRYYATRWSFMLDLSILVRTIPALIRYKDAS